MTCSTDGCPAPNDAEWHRCFICQREPIEHQHFPKKSLAGKGAKIVAALCPRHHQLITEHKLMEGIYDHPDGTKRYYVKDLQGKDLCDVVIGHWQVTIDKESAERMIENIDAIIGPESPETLQDAPESLPAVNEAPPIQYHPTSLVLPESLPYERWLEIGQTLWEMHKAWQWWFADWWNFGERHYGELSAQGLPLHREPQTLMNVAWVGRQFETSRRREILSFKHHAEVAALEPAQQDELLDRAEAENLSTRDLRQLVKSTKIKALTSSESNEWYTPKQYIEAVREVLGEIDLDPASHETADQIVQAKEYYDIETNGLLRDWRGRVFLNPPYGPLVPLFIEKLDQEFAAGRVQEAIALVNAHSTDANWFQVLWNHVLCFTNHRIDFYRSEDLVSIGGSTHGSVFIYLGPNEAKFAEAFRQFGAVVKRYGNHK